MLCQNTFSSPFLSRLNFTLSSLVIESTLSGLHLAESIRLSWESLEQSLVLMSEMLLYYSNHLFPLDFTWWRLPSTYHLEQSFPSASQARKRAIQGRDAFLPLLALCSYAMSLYTSPADYTIQNKWYNVLIQKGMHPPIVDAIRDSEIAHFDLPRAGVIIHATYCVPPMDIHYMFNANIPVYIYWGDTTRILPSDIMETHRLTLTEVRELLHPPPMPLPPPLASTEHPSSEPWSGRETTPTAWESTPTLPPPPPSVPSQSSSSNDLPVLPKVHPLSGQRQGETWQEFMVRRQELIRRKIENETRQQEARRESLLKESTRGLVKSATVFQWLKDDDTGFRLRTRVFKRCADDVWEDYKPCHRRYDPVHNEWDLCTEFGDGSSEDHSNSDDDEDYDTFFFDDPPTSLPTTFQLSPDREQRMLALVASRKEVFEIDANNLFGQPELDSMLSISPIYLETALEKQYGFRDCLSLDASYQSKFDKQLSYVSDIEWEHLCNRYVQKPANPDISARLVSIINHFTSAIPSLDLSSPWFSSEISSFHPSSPQYSLQYLWDLRASHPDSIVPKLLTSPFTIECHTFGLRRMYRIMLTKPVFHLEVGWHLFIESPLTVLQCIRERWGSGLKDIALKLATIGAPFHMLTFTASSAPRPQSIPGVALLGYRNAGYVPSLGDYTQYVEI